MEDPRKELREQLNQIAEDCGDNLDRAGEITSQKIYSLAQKLNKLTVLSYDNGKAVQEVLNRYLSELRRQQDHVSDKHLWSDGSAEDLRRELAKDIDYIAGLAKLFD